MPQPKGIQPPTIFSLIPSFLSPCRECDAKRAKMIDLGKTERATRPNLKPKA